MQSWMIGLVLGIVQVGLWSRLPGWQFILLLGAAAVLLLRWPLWSARLCSGLALGSVLAIAHGNALQQHRLPEACVKQPLTLVGLVSSLPRRTLMPDDSKRQRFEFEVQSIHPPGCSGPRRLLLSYYGPEQIIPTEQWRFQGKLKKPWGLANPASYNMQAWFAQSGIDAVGSVGAKGAQRLADAGLSRLAHHRLRLGISERIATLDLPDDVLAMLRAITVADKSGIDAALWSLLQQFGINHLLVISGLHVGLVAGAGYLLGAVVVRIFLWRGAVTGWVPGAMAMALAFCYAALAGFSLATQRAVCMLACFIVAAFFGRSSRAVNNLLLAAVVVLLLNPLAALGSGFWLSFGAVAALLWLSAWQRGASLPGRVLGTHIFMGLVMLPMGAWWFGGSSLIGALANLLMIPLVGFVVVPLALLGVVTYLLGWSVDATLWQLAAWPLTQLLPLAIELASESDHWLYRHFSPSLPAVMLALAAVMLLIVPGGLAQRLAVALLALPLLLPAVTSKSAAPQETHVTVLDVGQGTSVVIRAGNRALLYDTGGGDPAGVNMATAVVLPYLRRQGVTALDTLVVSHPDMDHSAGTAALLQALPVTRLRYGAQLAGVAGGQRCIAGEAWRWPAGQAFQFLSPARAVSRSTNDSSCVLQVQIGAYRLLLPGDIGADLERSLVHYWGADLRSDWLLAAHHGSRSSSSIALLKTVRPSITVISNGYANRFGHPHPLVLQRLAGWDTQILSTAESGALEFVITPAPIVQLRMYRQQRQRFWM